MIQTKIILCILILVVLSIYIFYKYFEGFQNSPPTDATILKDRILDIIKYSDWGDTTRDIYEIGPDVGDISNWYVYILDILMCHLDIILC